MRILILVSACLLTIGVKAADTLHITLVGDILLDRGVRNVIDDNGYDALFSPSVDSLFAASHVVVANLECPVTHIHNPQQKPFIFRADPEALPFLRRHGITHLSLANNHSIDQGRNGLTDTYNNIKGMDGLTPMGYGTTMQEAARPTLLATSPRYVWLFAVNRLTLENFAYLPEQPSISQQPLDSLLQQVRRLKHDDPDAYVIIYPHWGIEHRTQPTVDQRHEAHQLIDAGADIIIGHHPHCIQQHETYRGRHIFYSIGNFIFDQPKPINSQALAINIHITTEKTETTAYNIYIQHCTPNLKEPFICERQ